MPEQVAQATVSLLFYSRERKTVHPLLMPTSHDRTREAVDRALYQEHAIDGPGTAQNSD